MLQSNNPNLKWDIEAQYETLKSRFFMVVTAFVGLMSILSMVANATGQFETGSGAVLPFLLLIMTIVTLYFLSQQRFVNFLINLILLTMVVAFWVHPNVFPLIAMTFLTVNMSAVFAERQVFGFVVIAGFIRMISLGVTESNLSGMEKIDIPLLGALVLALALLVISSILRYFFVLLKDMAFKAGRSTTLLENAAEVTTLFSVGAEREVLLNRFVSHVIRQFDYDYAQVFLLDEEHTKLILEATDSGKKNLSFQIGDSLPITLNTNLGLVARTGDEINQSNIRTIAGEYLVPDAKSRLILPIVEGQKVIGVFDVQRTATMPFDQNDIQAMRLLLMQLGTALRIVELEKEQDASIKENKRLFIESQTNIREIQRLNQELTRRAWDQYISEEEHRNAVEVSSRGLNYQFDWTPQMIEASRQRRPVFSEDSSLMAVPIILRGEVLGVVEVAVAADMQGRQQMTDVVQAVSQRLAISLDNARLFEEAQRSTLQEQKINMIASEFETATSVDDLLQIALSELGGALGAQSGQIRLAQPQKNGSHEEMSS